MPGINQLPVGAEGAAALSLVYSSISWLCSAIFISVARLHREAWSYIAILLYFTLISTTASIIQQAYEITWYQDVKNEQFQRLKMFPNDPELAISNGGFGLGLALYYIQYYSYSVESMLVMFWAFELAQSVYGLGAKPKWKPILRKVNITGKTISVIFPLVTILLLRATAVQKVFVLFILLADLPLMVSLAIGSITMIAILARYIKTQKKFSNWTPPDQSGETDYTAATTQSSQSRETLKKKIPKTQGLYDRWLMVRFTIAFVVLALFEVTNTLFQVQSISNRKADSKLSAPDLSVGRTNQQFFLYLPGVTPGIFVFIVFGTTAGTRSSLKKFFIPKKWRSHDGSTRSCNFWLPMRKRVLLVDRESTPGYPFNDTDESQSNFTNSDFSKSADLTKPSAVAPPVSRYNKTFNPSRETLDISSSRPVTFQSLRYSRTDIGEEADAIKLRQIKSLDQIREDYYSPSPDHSDDSGPILPIMKNTDRRHSQGQIGVAISLKMGG